MRSLHRFRWSLRARAFAGSRAKVLSFAAFLVALLAGIEWLFQFDFSLGIFYVLPVVVAATVMTRWQVLAAAIFCAYVRGLFNVQETQLEHTLRFCMASIAYTSCGLLVCQITESRRRALQQYARIRFEQRLRHRAEEQLRLLVESSPAAILTVDSEGKIIAANQAAHQMLGLVQEETLLDKPVSAYFPIFLNALSLSPEIEHVRTSATTWARRQDHTSFPAATWFSIYGKGNRRSLAAIIVDSSEEVRERERVHYEQLVNHNQVLAGAVSHEIRNLCSAIAVVSSNLDRQPQLAQDPDFSALKSLVSALSRLASFDLRKRQRSFAVEVSLLELVEEFGVIVGPDWTDIDRSVSWSIPENFPMLQADRHSLLQVLLNLSQNALRAVESVTNKHLHITASADDTAASIRVCDTGPGMSDASHLFQPFRPGSDGSGLGLYVSREMVKSFGGELQYVPTEQGCCFLITVPLAHSTKAKP